MNIKNFWYDVLRQDADAIRAYFYPDAWVNWHNTNEHFTLEEFIRANCEYPNQWDGEVERMVEVGDLIISATHVYAKDHSVSFSCHIFYSAQG
ncbi:MAG: nuclear transport factor 2 family protein [Oscillospiraceae bacterium]